MLSASAARGAFALSLDMTRENDMNIGFVGVGRMGANMARRLKDRGFHVTTVFDVNRAAATSLAQELGCAASPTLGDVSAGADVVFTIVTDDAAMREIFTGADNLLANARGNYLSIAPRSRRRFMWKSSDWRKPPGRRRWKLAWLPASRRRVKVRSI